MTLSTATRRVATRRCQPAVPSGCAARVGLFLRTGDPRKRWWPATVVTLPVAACGPGAGGQAKNTVTTTTAAVQSASRQASHSHSRVEYPPNQIDNAPRSVGETNQFDIARPNGGQGDQPV